VIVTSYVLAWDHPLQVG